MDSVVSRAVLRTLRSMSVYLLARPFLYGSSNLLKRVFASYSDFICRTMEVHLYCIILSNCLAKNIVSDIISKSALNSFPQHNKLEQINTGFVQHNVNGNSAPEHEFLFNTSPQWNTADTGSKDPSVENPEIKDSPFKARSRSEYSYACFAYCQKFVLSNFYTPCPFTLTFSKTSPDFFQF